MERYLDWLGRPEVWTIWGVVAQGYYIPEIASQFFVMGLVSGIIGLIFHLNAMQLNDIPRAFDRGAADLLGAAMCVGMAQGIIIILGGTDASSGTVLNTILHSLSGAMQNFPPVVSAWLMYVFQSVFNFFVVSGSGQAAAVMPILVPLSDLIGVTRQTAVLAFNFGDGFCNYILPTSTALMGIISACNIPYDRWMRFMWKMFAIWLVVGTVMLVIAQLINYGPM